MKYLRFKTGVIFLFTTIPCSLSYGQQLFDSVRYKEAMTLIYSPDPVFDSEIKMKITPEYLSEHRFYKFYRNKSEHFTIREEHYRGSMQAVTKCSAILKQQAAK